MERCREGKLNLPKNLQGSIRDLTKLLLVADPDSRLDISQIKSHNFFKGLDWKQLKLRRLRPPFIPEYETTLDFLNDNIQSTFFNSNKYSATGGTNSISQKKTQMPQTKVLGDYHLSHINKAFADF